MIQGLNAAGIVLKLEKHHGGIHVSKDKRQALHLPLVLNEII